MSTTEPETDTDTADEPRLVKRRPDGTIMPGHSGNPSGRPALIKKMQELARAQTEAALNTLVECLKSEEGKVRVAAAVALLDRGYGRPAQQVQLDTDGAALMAGLVILPPVDTDA